jgi:dUTP pyrophosphatase
VQLAVKRLDPHVPLPAHQREDDAGLDLHITSDVSLAPGQRALVGTGIAVAIPPGWCGLVTPRSGLASKLGLSIVNSPGVVDAGYRGEIKLSLVNLDPRERLELRRGDRAAQMVVVAVASLEPVVVDELPASERGTAGFGSTGRS